jgi:maltose alpha-D-glucosyltransferase/alpha-amylase
MDTLSGDRDRLTRWFVDELPAHLPGWLVAQRWFGGKARDLASAAVRDVVWLPASAPPVAIVVADLRYASAPSGERERCALLLGAADGGDAPIAPLPGADARVVADLATDGGAVWALLAGLGGGTPAAVGARGGAVIYADTAAEVRPLLAAAMPPVRPVGGEQSNTSIRIGATHVFKLFRRLEPGEHPQLEVGRFLARAEFAAVPRLAGSLVYRDADGQESALGVLEGWVENDGDGWRYVLARLDACRLDAGNRAELYADLVALGETTADFHAALAGETRLEAFARAPAGPMDTVAWQHAVADQGERTLRLLERRLPTLPAPTARLAEAVVAARPGIALLAPELPSAPGLSMIRIHGDFHLGQTLKTPRGFVIIDFEGEPSKPLAVRRQKHCALKDVAGMLRSLDYASASSDLAAGEDAPESAPLDALRQAFLEGYYTRAGQRDAGFLPSTVATRDALTSLFELEKALYEVEYELNNRPTWATIPLAALVRLLGVAR